MFSQKKKFVDMFITFLLASCVHKTIWQGQYITLETVEIPKEDFKVSHYIVVAYTPQEHDKNSKVIYQFDIMENNKRVRVIQFTECVFLITEKPAPNRFDKGKDYDYALTEVNSEDFGKLKHLSVIRGTTYKLYEKLHTYEEIKQEVIDVLLRRELMPEE